LLVQPIVVHRDADDSQVRAPPIPFTAPAGLFDRAAVDPEFEQVPESGLRLLPLFPVAEPDPPPQPLIHRPDIFVGHAHGCA